MTDVKLTVPQREVLQRLWLTRNAYRDVGLRRRGAVTNVLTRLERAGFVYKQRGYPWTITDAGEAILKNTSARPPGEDS